MLTYHAACSAVHQHRDRLEADATRLRRQPPRVAVRTRRRQRS
jgi:hypothetical protein